VGRGWTSRGPLFLVSAVRKTVSGFDGPRKPLGFDLGRGSGCAAESLWMRKASLRLLRAGRSGKGE